MRTRWLLYSIALTGVVLAGGCRSGNEDNRAAVNTAVRKLALDEVGTVHGGREKDLGGTFGAYWQRSFAVVSRLPRDQLVAQLKARLRAAGLRPSEFGSVVDPNAWMVPRFVLWRGPGKRYLISVKVDIRGAGRTIKYESGRRVEVPPGALGVGLVIGSGGG